MILYVARYKWPFRLITILFVLLLGFLLPSVPNLIRTSGWLFDVLLILAYGLALLGLLETFVRQTWLTEAGIHQRSTFGTTTFIPYSDIRELVIEPEEALLVKYGDNRNIKIHAKEGDPEAIIEVARRFLDPNLSVVTV